MTGVVVAGWSAVSAAGIGAAAVAERVALRAAAVPAGHVPGDGAGGEPLPARPPHRVPGFDVRAELGRKGTSTYDRNTALAVVCARDALAAAGLDAAVLDGEDGAPRTRVGVSLGTTVGSLRSTSDYSRETLVQERPYLVNPMLFPNTVMNGAAGQVAIRFGLRGVNATVTGGVLAFLNAARYALSAIERGYADVMLTGAVEEDSAHRAWAQQLTDPDAAVGAGEAAAMFVLAAPGSPPGQDRPDAARLRAVATGFGPGGRADDALAGCVRRVLHRAGIGPAEVTLLASGERDLDDRSELGPVAGVLGHEPARLLVEPLFGRCDAASGAVAMAAVLAGPGGTALLTARGPDGAVGAAIVEGRTGGDAAGR